MSLQKLIEKIRKTTNESSNVSDLDLSREDLLKLCEAAEVMSGAMIILKDDADFFHGDVRKLTAWERFSQAIDQADQICKE